MLDVKQQFLDNMDFLLTPIKEVEGLSDTAKNALMDPRHVEDVEYYTGGNPLIFVAQLYAVHGSNFPKIPGMGKKTITGIKTFLEEGGIDLVGGTLRYDWDAILPKDIFKGVDWENDPKSQCSDLIRGLDKAEIIKPPEVLKDSKEDIQRDFLLSSKAITELEGRLKPPVFEQVVDELTGSSVVKEVFGEKSFPLSKSRTAKVNKVIEDVVSSIVRRKLGY